MPKRYNDTVQARATYLVRCEIGWLHCDAEVFKGIKIPRTGRGLEQLMNYLEQNMSEVPERVRPRLNYIIKRTREWHLHCNHDSKYMYFCDLPPGHEGNHQTEGLCWPTHYGKAS